MPVSAEDQPKPEAMGAGDAATQAGTRIPTESRVARDRADWGAWRRWRHPERSSRNHGRPRGLFLEETEREVRQLLWANSTALTQASGLTQPFVTRKSKSKVLWGSQLQASPAPPGSRNCIY
ncbi:unnamed protein product [Natator depressus]